MNPLRRRTRRLRAGWSYECGCDPDRVGQAFEGLGRIVCPTHRVGIRELVRPERGWWGSAKISLELEARTREAAEAAVDRALEQLVGEVEIRALVVTVQEHPA